MRASRSLLGAALVGLFGDPAMAQPDAPAFGSVAAVDPLLNRAVTAPEPMPTATLTGAPGGLPPGSYASPWSGSSPAGCCGPVGAHGPTPYELYLNTGPIIPLRGSDLGNALNGGWYIGGGGRTLFLNAPRDAGWVLDLGLSYAYNDGRRTEEIISTFAPRSRAPQNQVLLPDGTPSSFLVRGLNRTSFNFAIGRDWFGGAAAGPGCDSTGGWRQGPEIGGRWISSRIDLIPVLNTATSFRRSNVGHGIFLGYHWDYEVPVGSYVFFTGFKVQWNYDWMNLIPPLDGDLSSVNLLGNFGFRF